MWEELYPWTEQPTITKITQSFQLSITVSEIFIKNSQFLSVQNGPALKAADIALVCMIDQTSFCSCSSSSGSNGAAISMELKDKGSFFVTRSIISECYSNDLSGCNSAKIRTEIGGSIELVMTSISKSHGNGECNVLLQYGHICLSTLNTSGCRSAIYSAVLVDFSKNSRISMSNFCHNEASKSGTVYVSNGLVEDSNFISNTELTEDEKKGVIRINTANSILKVFQCYIKGNSRLSMITDGTIDYIRCYIDSDNRIYSGNINIMSEVTFNRYRMTLYASKDVHAEVPYRSLAPASSAIKPPLMTVAIVGLYIFSLEY